MASTLDLAPASTPPELSCASASAHPPPAGLLQGVYVVSTDSCMYAEDLALRLALTRVDPSQQQSVLTAFK